MMEENQLPRTPDPRDPYGEQPPLQPQQPPQVNPGSDAQPGSGAAIASLVLGIVGLFFAGIILGIIGLVMAAKAKREGYTGGIRTAGFVLSLIALIVSAVLTVIILVAFVAALSVGISLL